MPLPDDIDELAVVASRGDRAAVNTLIARIHPKVLAYCRRRIGRLPSHSAEDVAQEVCLAVVTALRTYEDRGRFAAFVYGIAAHKLVDALRDSARLPEPVAVLPELECNWGGPEEAAMRIDDRTRLGVLLSVLTPRQRQILYLRIFRDLSVDETAARLDTSPGSVRVGQHRALARLRAVLAVPVTGRCRSHPVQLDQLDTQRL